MGFFFAGILSTACVLSLFLHILTPPSACTLKALLCLCVNVDLEMYIVKETLFDVYLEPYHWQ
jgi:hypothetical protein